MPEEKPLAGRIAVVTGASRGIGYHAAKGFAAAGAHVVAVARTVGGLEELDDEIKAAGGSATLVPLDLKDYRTASTGSARRSSSAGRSSTSCSPTPVFWAGFRRSDTSRRKIWDDVIAVNVTANWRLIRSLDPLLRQSDAGRALFMTSVSRAIRRPFWGPYSVSKAALEVLVADLRQGNREHTRSASRSSTPAAYGQGSARRRCPARIRTSCPILPRSCRI